MELWSYQKMTKDNGTKLFNSLHNGLKQWNYEVTKKWQKIMEQNCSTPYIMD